MVKFTSTVVTASLFAGSALAAPIFSGSDNVVVTAREIEAMFGREMVEYASRSPHHLKEVTHVVNAVGNVVSAANQRREYYESPLVARGHSHGEHPHNHNGHSHSHNGGHPHPHPQVQPAVEAPVDTQSTQASDAGTTQRRAYDEPSLVARGHSHGEHPHNHNSHSHSHNGGHPHPHPHVQPAVEAPVDTQSTQGSDAGTTQPQRRSYDDYYGSFVARDVTDGSVDASAASAPAPAAQPHPHPHHPVHHQSVHHHTTTEAKHKWQSVIAKIHEKQQAAGVHHPHGHVHSGAHSHSHSASAPAPPTADAAPVNPAPARRSLDFDELYTRYIDFDELD